MSRWQESIPGKVPFFPKPENWQEWDEEKNNVPNYIKALGVKKADSYSADDSAVFRDLINQEGELLNQRISWLCTINGLAFAGVAFAWDKGLVPVLAISIVVVVSSLVIWRAVRVGSMAVGRLVAAWEYGKKPDKPLPVIGYYERGTGWMWVSIPACFLFAWGLIGVGKVIEFKTSSGEKPKEATERVSFEKLGIEASISLQKTAD